MIYSSKTHRSYFDSTIHSNLPQDAVEIGYEKHQELLNAATDGCVIDWEQEPPVALPKVIPTEEQLLERRRRYWSVSRFQARAALIQLGKMEQVEAYINAPTTDRMVKEAWDSVQEFRRMSLMIMNVAIILGWSDEELDHLFEVAEAIGEV